jgi:hypothetical protein
MIKELALPQCCSRGRRPRLAQRADPPTRPTFPRPDKFEQLFSIKLRSAKEMHVIRHDHIATHSPAMSFMRGLPFLDENRCAIARENGPAILRASCDEVNR